MQDQSLNENDTEKVKSPGTDEVEACFSKEPAQSVKNITQDEALDLVSVSNSNSIHVTPEEDARLLRKIDRQYDISTLFFKFKNQLILSLASCR